MVYFIVANTTIDKTTYEDMEAYFLECEEAGKTYREVFENNPVMEQFKALVVRNRRRLVWDFAKAIGAVVRGRDYTKGASKMEIANIEIETQTCYTKFREDKLILYSNCTSSDDVQNGLIFTRAPLQAPLVYVGPKTRATNALFNGNKWVNDHNNVFPSSYGKHVKPSTFRQFSKLGISLSSLNQKLIVDGEPETNEDLLRHFPYRERTTEFRRIEKALGYNVNNCVPVSPHLVRWI